jgi:hypothetical protein
MATNNPKALFVRVVSGIILLSVCPLQAFAAPAEPPFEPPTVAQVSQAFEYVRDWAHTIDGWFTSYATSPMMQFLRSAKRFGLWLYGFYQNRAEIEAKIKEKVESTCGFFMVKSFATQICKQ